MAASALLPSVDPRGRALLAQCLDAPDDPIPRSVYADWLEEQGHPFAQVLRAPSDAEADALAAPYKASWFGAVRDWIPETRTFRRGLLTRLYGPTRNYTAPACQQDLLAVLPVFGTRMTMVDSPHPSLGDCEALAWSLGLHWSNCQLDDPGLTALARSPHVARLTEVALVQLRCGPAGLDALAASPFLRRVHRLALYMQLHGGDFEAAAMLQVLDALPIDELDLRRPRSLELAELVNAPAAARLHRLALHALSAPELGTVIRAEQLISLEELSLDVVGPVDDAVVEPLLTNPAFARLEKLTLRCRGVSPALASRLRDRLDLTLR